MIQRFSCTWIVPMRRLPIQTRRLLPSSTPSRICSNVAVMPSTVIGPLASRPAWTGSMVSGRDPAGMGQYVPPGRGLNIKSFAKRGNQYADDGNQPEQDNDAQNAR